MLVEDLVRVNKSQVPLGGEVAHTKGAPPQAGSEPAQISGEPDAAEGPLYRRPAATLRIVVPAGLEGASRLNLPAEISSRRT